MTVSVAQQMRELFTTLGAVAGFLLINAIIAKTVYYFVKRKKNEYRKFK